MTNDLSSPYITPVVPAQHDENRLGQPRRAWMDGPAAPLVTPFHKDYTVNHEALAAQVVRVARERCGVVLLGTTGEGGSQTSRDLDPLKQITILQYLSLTTHGSPPVASLSESERLECVKTARKALDDAGLSDAPLMVGTGCKLFSHT
jgi:dihydrodipicolinate synthase/N-acetylneuraminate lyase